MIAVIGYGAVVVALAASGMLVVNGVRRSRGADVSVIVPATVLMVAAGSAFVALELGILTYDFSIAYIANNTATTTPLVFLFAAGWAALEGSIVLWGVFLGLFIWIVARSSAGRDGLGAMALAVMGLVSVFWFGVMASVANPFAVCTEVVGGVCSSTSWFPLVSAVAPAQGLGPNPLLQNHILMAIHPPMLYVGYVGMTVPFGFAIAALVRSDTGTTWLDRTHRWTLVSWIFLAAGIILGAWWSYEVLGWGGYWAWDPVENAAFLPWLAATAFLHSAIVQRRRGMLQAWNFMLVIATFSLTIFGTFLTRSGVIASVHAFTQSAIGPAILVFLVVVVVGSLTVFALKASTVAQSPRLDSLVSREGFILANNLLLTVLTFAVLFGTMYPLIVESLSGDQVSVGRSFYDRASIPLALLLLLTMAVGSVAPWRVAKPDLLWRRLRWPIATALALGAVAVLGGLQSVGVVVTLVLAVFVIGAIAQRYLESIRQRPESMTSAAVTVIRNDKGYWGGQIAHIGVALMAVALATSSGLAVRESVAIDRGGSAQVDGYCLTYVDSFEVQEPHRTVSGVLIGVYDTSCSTQKAVLEPSINAYPGVTQPIGTPDVLTTFSEDVYLAIAGGTIDRIQLNVFIFPYQWLLWVGGLVVVVGGAVALMRKPSRRPEPSKPDATHPETSHV